MLLLGRLVLITIVVMAASRPLEALPSLLIAPFALYETPPHVTHASWYGSGFFHHVRADGERYRRNELFAAHRTYPIGTKLHVVNLRNHRSIDVTVRDRGPYVRKHGKYTRGLDLSWRAAGLLGMRDEGIALVAYNVVQ